MERDRLLNITYKSPLQSFWTEIRNKCKDTTYIKKRMQKEEITVHDVNDRGQTLLMLAASEGAYDTVQLCLNLGANVMQTDHKNATALWYAHQGAYVDVEELLLFATTNQYDADRIRDIAHIINKQKGIISNIYNALSNIGDETKNQFMDTLMDAMVHIIAKKLSFSDTLLNLCWFVLCHDTKQDPLESKLWIQLNKTCKDIIENGNERDLFWMKTYIIPSTIWYRNTTKQSLKQMGAVLAKEWIHKYNYFTTVETKTEDVDHAYFKLLQTCKMQKKCAKEEINAMMKVHKEQNTEAWNSLVSWNVSEEHQVSNIRQDTVMNGVECEYSFEEITNQHLTSSTFNAYTFYDYVRYLPQLQLVAQSVDESFHECIQQIFDIDPATNTGILSIDDSKDTKMITYQRISVKHIQNAVNEAKQDHCDKTFPTSACVLDWNQCCLVFNEMDTFLLGMNRFSDKIKNHQSGNIINIVKCTNMFETRGEIILHVVIKAENGNIVGQIKFCLNEMTEFLQKSQLLDTVLNDEPYFRTLVPKILPLLLNEDTRIFVAARRGAVDALRTLMVDSNKTAHDIIMFCNENGQSVLSEIVKNGHIQAFEYLQNSVAADLFIEYLLDGNDKAPILSAIENNQLVIIAKLLTNSQFRQQLKANNAQLFQLMYLVFKYGTNEYCIDFMLTTLDPYVPIKQYVDYKTLKKKLNTLSQNQSIAMLKNVFSSNENTGIVSYSTSTLKNAVSMIMDYNVPVSDESIESKSNMNDETNNVQTLLSILGKDKFVEYILKYDTNNMNPLQYAISVGNISTVKYLFKFENIKHRIIEDENILSQIVYWSSKNDAMMQYIRVELNLDNQKIHHLHSYAMQKFQYK